MQLPFFCFTFYRNNTLSEFHIFLRSIIVRKLSRDSTVGVATGYRLDGQGLGVRVPVGARFFFSLCHPDWFWGPPSLLSNGYQGLFPLGLSGWGMKLTTDLQLVLRSRIHVSIHSLPHTSLWHGA
jgi:hypothetical protein